MIDVRIHGRGGQGSLVLAQFMAIAALEDGKYGQAFPFLGGGGERRGKAIMAFCRLDDKPIRIRSRVENPDCVIVQDVTILGETDVFSGLKENGIALVNTEKSRSELGIPSLPWKLFAISADELARSILGKPIINSALLGAFAGLTNALSLEAAIRAVLNRLPGELGEKNARIVKESYARMMERLS
ncbi:MAG: 2-oxoacid:acceptor oxidoreductase family protein [Deltaproteobacteria bacterium]|nr:2-oxoacid:acceptor oxidoreductase family protein [Deltaproteobacteria bacterium]